jgi:hypothetical protein
MGDFRFGWVRLRVVGVDVDVDFDFDFDVGVDDASSLVWDSEVPGSFDGLAFERPAFGLGGFELDGLDADCFGPVAFGLRFTDAVSSLGSGMGSLVLRCSFAANCALVAERVWRLLGPGEVESPVVWGLLGAMIWCA